jgi:23S rRNA A2030 N6-methylase RlmJ
VKHSLLPPLITSYGDSLAGDWTYCETHAGYYVYPLSMLKNGGDWRGERAWSVGVLEQSGQLHTLGEYGRELSGSLKMGVYPGSIRLIASLAAPARPTRILGWDIGEAQVESFSGQDSSVTVSLHDGYSSVDFLEEEKRLVFCDPFWTDAAESSKVQALIEKESAVVVWYPLSRSTDAFRAWLGREPHPTIEMRFRHYVPNRNGWAGQDSQGAGMMLKGLPPSAFDAGIEMAKRLENRTHEGKERREKGKLIVPKNRNISLQVTVSTRGK